MSVHVKQQVENLMRLDQRYRDNDRDLLLAMWKQYGLELNTAQRLAFREAPAADVIIRRRRELSIKYPPSQVVADKRFKQYKIMLDEFSNQTFLQRLFKRRGI